MTFGNESASGWQEALFSSSVPVVAGTTYVVSYDTATGYYSADSSYFQTGGVTSGPLEALANGVDGANGVYRYGTTRVPSSQLGAANYGWT